MKYVRLDRNSGFRVGLRYGKSIFTIIHRERNKITVSIGKDTPLGLLIPWLIANAENLLTNKTMVVLL